MKQRSEKGVSLVEVMVATVIAGIAMMGTMTAVELSSRYLAQGNLSTRALALAQGRVEAKRSVRWQSLLEDDLDHDGVAEIIMRDDGTGGDVMGGDGIYSAMQEQNGVTLVWTIQADRRGPLSTAGIVAITAEASFLAPGGIKKVQVATLRANPSYVSPR